MEKSGGGGNEIYFYDGDVEIINVKINHFNDKSFSGSSSESATCKSHCLIGQYGNCSISKTSASNCYVNCKCDNCSIGTSYSLSSSTLPSDCSECDSGTYSSYEGASNCISCPAEKYATNNRSDTSGGLNENTHVITGATTCNDCPAGYYTSNSEKYTCSTCEAGTISFIGAQNCSDCPIGKISADGDASCLNCIAGRYGQVVGSSFCISCDTSKTSSPGSNQCDQSIAGYFLLNNGTDVITCPQGAECLGGYLIPIPNKGYWIDRSKTNYFKYPYACPRDTCIGSYNSTCWTEDTIIHQNKNNNQADTTCNNDELQCLYGSYGPLCGSCIKGYSYSTEDLICTKCSNQNDLLNYIILFIILFLIIIFILLKYYHIIDIPKIIWESWFILILRHLFKSGSLKVLISAYQIIQSVTYSMEVEYPKIFSMSLKWLSFLALDLPGLECSGMSIYDRVYFASLSPMILAFIIVLIGKLRIIKLKNDNKILQENNNNNNDENENVQNEKIRKAKNTPINKKQKQKLSPLQMKNEIDKINSFHAWSLLFLSYLVLPPVTGKQLKALDCFPFSNTDHRNLLRLDTSVDCDSIKHQYFEIIDSLLIIIYLSIPIIWLLLLYQNRHKLWPIGVYEDSLIIQRRKAESSLIVLGFLYERYKPSMACFESFDIMRRILFVGIIPLLASTAKLRSAIGLAFSLLSMIIYREMTPFLSTDTNNVAYIADIVIYLTYASALMIETGLNNGMNDFYFGLILIAINFSILITAIIAASFRTMLVKEISWKKKKYLTKQCENACDFSLHKFESIFDMINNTLISKTHCCLLHYTSLEECHHILTHGIPAYQTSTSTSSSTSSSTTQESKPGGIVFTLHHPHQIDDFDRAVFNSFEAFIVVSLPKRFLQPFHPFPSSSSSSSSTSTSTSTNKEEKSESDSKTTPLFIKTSKDNLDNLNETHDKNQHIPTIPSTNNQNIKHDKINNASSSSSSNNSSSSSLWVLPHSVLHALRSDYFEDILEPFLWNEGVLLLSPHVIKRAYQIDKHAPKYIEYKYNAFRDLFDHSNYIKKKNQVFPILHDDDDDDDKNNTNPDHHKTNELVCYKYEEYIDPLLNPILITKIDQYVDIMTKVRKHCSENDLIPIYHYTKIEIAILIIKSGFKIYSTKDNGNSSNSSGGSGSGGVYFSTLGPASYDLGSPEYEENIIIDCFGIEKLEEMRGKHQVDVCMVYGIDPLILDQFHYQTSSQPSDDPNIPLSSTINNHTFFISQEIFQDFSLSHADGSFFLRNDRLLTCFHILDHHHSISSSSSSPTPITTATPITIAPNDHDNNHQLGTSSLPFIMGLDHYKVEIDQERVYDLESFSIIQRICNNKKRNEKLIESILTDVAPHIHLQWAVTYGSNKFNDILTKLEIFYQNQNQNQNKLHKNRCDDNKNEDNEEKEEEGEEDDVEYALYYHYGSVLEIEKYVRCGIPVIKHTKLNPRNTLPTSPSLISASMHSLTSPSRMRASHQNMNESMNESSYQQNNNNHNNNTVADNVSSRSSKGVVFTTHHPDQLSDIEIQFFGNCEAFLTCFLPKRLLKPYKTMTRKLSMMDNHRISKLKLARNSLLLPSSPSSLLSSSSLSLSSSASSPSPSSSLMNNNQINNFKTKPDLFFLPKEILSGMRGHNFDKLLDPVPWYDDLLLLPPQCIKNAFQILSEESLSNRHSTCILNSNNCMLDIKYDFSFLNNINNENNNAENENEKNISLNNGNSVVTPLTIVIDPLIYTSTTTSSSSSSSTTSTTTGIENISAPTTDSSLPVPSSSQLIIQIQEYISKQKLEENIHIANEQCIKNNLIPMYYYTEFNIATEIIKKGFKILGSTSNENNKQKGIYFSTRSPLFYNNNNNNVDDDYVDNIIKDFLGVEEFLEKNSLSETKTNIKNSKKKKIRKKLNVCVVYGMDPHLCEDYSLINNKIKNKNNKKDMNEYIMNENMLNSISNETQNETQTYLKLISYNMFKDFSLSDQDHNYYLRKDRIVGAFLITKNKTNINNNKIIPPKKIEQSQTPDILIRTKSQDMVNSEQEINSFPTNHKMVNASKENGEHVEIIDLKNTMEATI